MRPHPRIRRLVKWGGLALTGLLVVAWVGSGWGYVNLRITEQIKVGLDNGRMTFDSFPDGERYSVDLMWWGPSQGRRPNWRWWYYWDRFSGIVQLHIPLWFAIAPCLGTTATAWLMDRIARQRGKKRCGNCGYDRAGIDAAAPCPECGSPTPALTPPPPPSP